MVAGMALILVKKTGPLVGKRQVRGGEKAATPIVVVVRRDGLPRATQSSADVRAMTGNHAILLCGISWLLF